MCTQNTLQHYILDITNNGKSVADFLHATMQGKTPNANIHHRLEAAKQLRILGLTAGDIPISPEHPEDQAQERQRTPSPLSAEGWDEDDFPPRPVTDIDIINYETATLIREETNDGYFIADFLHRVMRGAAGNGNPISGADRIRAAKELLQRGLGSLDSAPGKRIPNSLADQELIHSGISRYIRERTEQGLDTVRFLLDVASGQEESFSMHQRIVAARELMRRGWDTNYDAITPDDIAAYRERQNSLEPTEHDIRLRQWRENERAAQEAQQARHNRLEDEPQLEAGIFSHLSEAEVARYEAMSATDRQKFIQQQRQRRASRQAAAQPTDSHEDTREPGQRHTSLDWETLLQDNSASTSAPHPIKSEALTHIRSP